ncbi:hypothetical protein L618_002300000540 [Rhodococcus rhodochrous J45]|uniref:DJ-1/PfpI family protein n=1 Tax=Rhodococcus rhodochrous J45 TaxID=935266 RepID=A0A562E4A9_RHORH|nr:hypothetical protein L618_002300000540 [Rhodococcus rhodochrous J45]
MWWHRQGPVGSAGEHDPLRLLYDVGVRDAFGPFKVFSVAARLSSGTEHEISGATLVSAHPDRKVVTACGGLRVLTDVSTTDAPPFDVLLIPGGVTVASSRTTRWSRGSRTALTELFSHRCGRALYSWRPPTADRPLGHDTLGGSGGTGKALSCFGRPARPAVGVRPEHLHLRRDLRRSRPGATPDLARRLRAGVPGRATDGLPMAGVPGFDGYDRPISLMATPTVPPARMRLPE